MVPSVESVAEVPGQPSVKQVALTVAFNDAVGPMHVISFSVRVAGLASDPLFTIHDRAIEQARRCAEAFLA